jgi:UDP-GlcNAc:undecaprenyl-phosphate GlcNAc-1-phosphate transferase
MGAEKGVDLIGDSWTALPPITGLLLIAVAAVAGALATWLCMQVARRTGFVNHPNPIVPQHTEPIAYLGGVGIALGATATLALAGAMTSPTASRLGGVLGTAGLAAQPAPLVLPHSLLVGSVWFLTLGLVDDLRPFPPPAKLLLQLAGATLVLIMAPFPAFTGVESIDAAIALLWYVTVINAVNFTDVCDGLVGGLAVVTLLYHGSGLAGGLAIDRAVALVLAGATLGFLVFNRPPARVFLGDAGSHLLGFALADLALRQTTGRPWWPGLVVMPLVVAVPLFELVFITAKRIQQGLPWWRGSPDHFSLRMQAAGFSKWRTDLIAWSLAIVGCAAAWAVRGTSGMIGNGIMVGLAIVAVVSWRALSRWQVTTAPRGREDHGAG